MAKEKKTAGKKAKKTTKKKEVKAEQQQLDLGQGMGRGGVKSELPKTRTARDQRMYLKMREMALAHAVTVAGFTSGAKARDDHDIEVRARSYLLFLETGNFHPTTKG
jgi:hypothetical protein